MDDAQEAMDAAGRAAETNADFRPVTVGNGIVTRPASEVSDTAHSYLTHLRGKGLRCVPDPLSVRDGVETLSYIDGASGGDGWYHQHTEQGLMSAARLLRTIHDAGRDWNPPATAVWGAAPVAGDEVVFCHGDPGPWNFVWRDQEAVGLIDWDYLHPAPRLDDVAYALRWFAPLRRDEFALDWHHFPVVPDRRLRVRTFVRAYGGLPGLDVGEAVSARMQATSDLMRRLAQAGSEPQRTWVADGALDREAAEIAWGRDHSSEFAYDSDEE
ncbi:phosphotransferase [Occultella kanbiaonis]|uniref:phosphotransferase n=1 Tax=Occultella kanbiaonis TaxID=2675754 RepID=UPI001E5E26B6|nr:aminoglycoside phosphotransferase family protein [Occultella kanbiaonis]